MSSEPPPPARIVKPRKPGSSPLPIIALTGGSILLERTGETFDIEELPSVVVAEKSSILVAEGMGEHTLRLHEAFKDSEEFQYKLTPVYRDRIPTRGPIEPRASRYTVVTSLIGFPGNYHHPIEPSSFVRKTINELDPSARPEIVRLLEWAQEVREFCLVNDLKIKPSSGGIAAQLLRDPRFYPQARRKAPKLINGKLREKMPGNFYHLNCEPGWRHRAAYLDMENSHHELARRVAFPCVNSMFAYGYFDHEFSREWATRDSDRFRQLLKLPGAFLVRLHAPINPPGRFVPPCMEGKAGMRPTWIYSNELPLIESLGGSVDAIYAAVVSDETEHGLNRYAEWAISELEKRKSQKGWLKSVLHSTYGLLAGKPIPLEFGWHRANGGEEEDYPLGTTTVPVKVLKTRKPVEPKIVNVIHRSMIEAEQRKATIELANELTRVNGRVLCLYADSLFVAIEQLPLLPAPWRLKREVSNLRFLSSTQFVSDGFTRLPGVPRYLQDDFSRRAVMEFSRILRGSRRRTPAQLLDFTRNRKRPNGRKGKGNGRLNGKGPAGQGMGATGAIHKPPGSTGG